MSDLKKMPVIAELLSDSKHCADFSYLFELYSCGDPSCKFGCEVWPQAAEGSPMAAFQAQLKKRTPLPRLAKDGEHFKSYAECCMLCDNDECDLPSAKESLPTLLLKKMKALDHEKKEVFVVSKMRDAIICSECGRPRLIYSMQKPKKKLLDALDVYKEGVDYVCGGPLFDEEEVTGGRRDAQGALDDVPHQAHPYVPQQRRELLLQLLECAGLRRPRVGLRSLRRRPRGVAARPGDVRQG